MKFTKKEKIKILEDMKKRHPNKKNMLNDIIKGYKTGLITEKKTKFSNFDMDKDGKKNKNDCNPYDPNKQDYNPNVIVPAPRERKTPVFRGYNVDDYYYDGSGWHLNPGAEPAEKKGILSRLFK